MGGVRVGDLLMLLRRYTDGDAARDLHYLPLCLSTRVIYARVIRMPLLSGSVERNPLETVRKASAQDALTILDSSCCCCAYQNSYATTRKIQVFIQ